MHRSDLLRIPRGSWKRSLDSVIERTATSRLCSIFGHPVDISPVNRAVPTDVDSSRHYFSIGRSSGKHLAVSGHPDKLIRSLQSSRRELRELRFRRHVIPKGEEDVRLSTVLTLWRGYSRSNSLDRMYLEGSTFMHYRWKFLRTTIWEVLFCPHEPDTEPLAVPIWHAPRYKWKRGLHKLMKVLPKATLSFSS